MKTNYRKLRCYIPILSCICSVHLFGQSTDTTNVDSIRIPGFVQKVKKAATDETNRSLLTYKEGRISKLQRQTINAIRTTSQSAKLYMKDGLDTSDIINDLDLATRSLSIAREGVLTDKGSTQTQRNLSVTAAILTELLQNLSAKKLLLDNYAGNLIEYKDRIDSLSSDTSLYYFPDDSVAIVKYAKRLIVVSKEIGPIDSSLKKAVTEAQELQLKVDLMVNDLRSFSEDVEIYRSNLASGALNRELPNIWERSAPGRPVSEILRFSLAKEKLALGFYIREHLGRLLLILLLITAAWFFTRSVKKLTKQQNLPDSDFSSQLVLKYPILSAIFIVLNLFQFIFIYPPFIFNFCIWSVSVLCLTIIFREIITLYWRRFWYLIILFFILSSGENFLLQASRPERWLMSCLALSGLLLVLYIIPEGRRKELKEKGLVYFVVFVTLVETLSFLFNLFGRFNISKSFLITGYSGMIVAILFLWTVRLINQMLGLAYKVYKFPDRKMFYINFNRIGTEVPGFFYVLLVAGWFILMGRNFYSFRLIAAPLENFLLRTRTVGEFSFSIGSIFIFLFILLMSVLLSRIISFFASAPASPHGTIKGDRVGIGSWLLLVRIFILSIGLFLAFAATGIPLDRLTIILGALGVGIGLGLQSLVTNLVSGLIIAFEKPVNVGDIIELNGKLASVKSIGFRSSIARLSDGSHIVIPNGDVLSQHIVNWSMGKNMKKTGIIMGLAYGTDIVRAKQLFLEIMENTEQILKNPTPSVHAKNFGAYSIDFELYFWVSHISEADSVRSHVITKINDECAKAGIVIPIPQQDINIRSAPENKSHE
jgi:potassium-dependent mechanosensitive channel